MIILFLGTGVAFTPAANARLHLSFKILLCKNQAFKTSDSFLKIELSKLTVGKAVFNDRDIMNAMEELPQNRPVVRRSFIIYLGVGIVLVAVVALGYKSSQPISLKDARGACEFLSSNRWEKTIASSPYYGDDITQWEFHPDGSFRFNFISDGPYQRSGSWAIKSLGGSEIDIILLFDSGRGTVGELEEYRITPFRGSIVMKPVKDSPLNEGNRLKRGISLESGVGDCALLTANDDSVKLAQSIDEQYKLLKGEWSNDSYRVVLGDDLKIEGSYKNLILEGTWIPKPSDSKAGTIEASGWLRYDNPFDTNPTYRDSRPGTFSYSYVVSDDKIVLKLISYSFNPNDRSVMENQKGGVVLTRVR